MATKKKNTVRVVVPRLATVRRPQADLDPGSLKLQGQKISVLLARSITAMELDQTIEGASTLTVTVADYNGTLLRSALLTGPVTMECDGIPFTLVKTSKGDRTMVLTFEETAANVLRRYSKPRKADRANTTRAQFVRTLITEPTEARIPYRIPEADVVQPVSPSAPS